MSEVFVVMVVCLALCCQTAISLPTWGHWMNSALSGNSLKVLGYTAAVNSKQREMPLGPLRTEAPFSFSGGQPSDFLLTEVRPGPSPGSVSVELAKNGLVL